MASKKKNSQDEVPAVSTRTHQRPPRNELPSRSSGKCLSFKAWFTNKLTQDKRLKEHHYEQIRLYLLGLGIPEMAEETQYEEALRYYFGS